MADTFLSDMAVADDELIDALGETVSVKDSQGADVGTVVGVFERQYVEVLDLQGYYPTFTYKESALVIEEGYEITHQAQTFNVRVKQPDGTGIVFLVLGKK